jgi:hypothetical protein
MNKRSSNQFFLTLRLLLILISVKNQFYQKMIQILVHKTKVWNNQRNNKLGLNSVLLSIDQTS